MGTMRKRKGLQTEQGTPIGEIFCVALKDEKYHGASMLWVEWKGADMSILAHALYRNEEAEEAVRAVGLDPDRVWTQWEDENDDD